MTFAIEITSVPDRIEVVAEIWWDDAMVAEVHRGPSGNFQIDIYARAMNIPWTFDLESWLSAVTEAQRKLLE